MRRLVTVTASLVCAVGVLLVSASPGAAIAGPPAATWLVQQPGGGCIVVTDPTPSRTYGLVSVAPAGTSTSVTVQILRGIPNERYTVNVTCIGAVGDVHTNASGRGTARIVIDRPLPFAIDVHLHCTSGDCSARWGEGARTGLLTVGR